MRLDLCFGRLTKENILEMELDIYFYTHMHDSQNSSSPVLACYGRWKKAVEAFRCKKQWVWQESEMAGPSIAHPIAGQSPMGHMAAGWLNFPVLSSSFMKILETKPTDDLEIRVYKKYRLSYIAAMESIHIKKQDSFTEGKEMLNYGIGI